MWQGVLIPMPYHEGVGRGCVQITEMLYQGVLFIDAGFDSILGAPEFYSPRGFRPSIILSYNHGELFAVSYD